MTTTDARPQLDVRRIAGALGAEVRGIDLTQPLGADGRRVLEELLLQHLVLFFPDQHLTPVQHRDFASPWGEMEIHPYLRKVEGFPEIVELSSVNGMVADEWHTDVTFSARPPVMSILNHVETPEVGGDTMWSNQYAVYEALSAADVLLIPVGGGSVFNAQKAAETVSLLEPKLVIPMIYQTDAATAELDPVEKFLKEMGIEAKPAEGRINITKSNVPASTTISLLNYRG